MLKGPADQWAGPFTTDCNHFIGRNGMADCLVTCVSKPDRFSQHSRIGRVGNPSASWIWTIDQVIESIEGKTNTFYTLDPTRNKRADIGVVREPGSVRTFGPTRIACGTTTYSPWRNARFDKRMLTR